MSNIDQLEIQEENVEEPEKKTYVALVIDESSSMGMMHDNAISLFNENLQTIKLEGKKNKINNVVSVIKFSTEVNVIVENVNVEEVEEITKETYDPSGMTAMYDGIGTAINILKKVPDYDDENVSFLLLVVTDGQENCSKEFTGKKLSEHITELQDSDKWTFTVLGSNIDLNQLSNTLGLAHDNVQSFDFSADGFSRSENITRGSLASYFVARSTGARSVTNFYEDHNNVDNLTSEEMIGNIISGQNSVDITINPDPSSDSSTDAEALETDASTGSNR